MPIPTAMIHELGHALDINDHDPQETGTDDNCVMKNPFNPPHVFRGMHDSDWENWEHFYGRFSYED
jgi:hypothetical protein